MTRKSIIAFAIIVASGVAHAGKVHDGYAALFSDQPGQVFTTPVSEDYLPATFGTNGDATSSWTGQVEGQRLKITVREETLLVNGKSYSFKDAVRLAGDDFASLDPRAITLFINRDTTTRQPAMCIEAAGTGSGTADRYAQVYVLAGPPGAKSNTRLYKLPSLFGSCRNLVRKGNSLQFMFFSYRREEGADSPVGANIQYFMIEGRRYVATEQHQKTRFTEPDNVFKFEVE